MAIRPRLSRRVLEQWFPTLARYLGLGVVIYIALVDQGRNPALVPLATFLILLKSVVNGKNGS